jgi:hypothetical protein
MSIFNFEIISFIISPASQVAAVAVVATAANPDLSALVLLAPACLAQLPPLEETIQGLYPQVAHSHHKVDQLLDKVGGAFHLQAPP